MPQALKVGQRRSKARKEARPLPSAPKNVMEQSGGGPKQAQVSARAARFGTARVGSDLVHAAGAGQQVVDRLLRLRLRLPRAAGAA